MSLINNVTLEFKDLFSAKGRESFPTVYVACDTAHLTMGFKIFLPDSLMRTMTFEDVKSCVSQIIDIEEWQMERDAALRQTELCGIKELARKRSKDMVGENSG